jgi:ATP-binding cassette subfamily B (MDR/TAP) protein 1
MKVCKCLSTAQDNTPCCDSYDSHLFSFNFKATSALDSESELVVQDALDNLVAERKRTTVVIAHRLSTVRNADKIAVINGGKVVEQGTHEELIARNGPYCALVNKQELRSSSTSSTDLAKLGEEPSLNASSALDGQASQFEFKNINFAYPSRPKRKIFDDFSLNIKTGETLALVGPSGGGKSTVVALIERFYDPMQGSVNYKGCDIRSLNLQWYRDQIGYVGQEPTLFNTTIAKNIAYGAPSATQEEIEEAARQANIHSTILSFPDGYKTEVGERGTQLSGGQKQRIAIARALVKKPSVLLLDEATSALDTDSEALVQEALDKLMASKERTTIVIAHRLSTIQSSDRIAFIAKGTVLECASHDDLMKLNGRYRRLVDSQNRSNEISANMLRMSTKSNADDDEEEDADVSSVADEAEEQASTGQIARRMAIPDTKYMVLGGIGAVFAGAVFPAWGYMYASMIELLFTVVPECTEGDFPDKSCDEYYDDVAKDMSQKSYELGVYWAVVALSCLFGNMVTFWGFGMSSERLNKRIRDSAYSSLVRQEVGYFDVRSVGNITSLLEDDAARIQTFSGEPIRTMLIALSSLIIGLVLAFVFMWPVALVAVACVPFVGAASSIDAAKTQGKDNEEDEVKDQDELYSPGGIIVETLLNIRTVAALTLEEKRSKDLEEALRKSRKDYVVAGFIAGLTSGLAVMIQNWSNALQLWFGGWVLFNYPDVYTFRDFLICYLGILFSMVGLGSAVSGLSDMKQAEESAKRVFQLLDRHTKIDPLSEEGKKLD